MKRSPTTLALLGLCALLSACSQIDTGNVGVERTLGKVGAESLPPGVYFTLFKSVDEFTTKEVSFSLNDMTPKSRDNLTMKDVDLDIYFKTTPGAVPGLYVKYQGDVVQHGDIVKGGTKDLVIAFSRVSREAREAVYKAIAQLDATTMSWCGPACSRSWTPMTRAPLSSPPSMCAIC
jgi:prohibitin 1